MQDFIYNANPSRVVFGSGSIAQIPAEVDRLGCRRVVVLSTLEQEHQAADIARVSGDKVAGHFAGAAMHTPTAVTEKAMQYIRDCGGDGLLSIGGGSTTGLGKALALRSGFPHIVLPTTYAGSEATPILGETENNRKVTKSDPRILPNTIIYDVDLTLSLPVHLSVTSGMNAIAHAVEALYAREANPVISMIAEQGMVSILRGLPRIVERPDDRQARSDCLYGAWLCGVCLGSVGMSLHHKLCHTLGGLYGLPHAPMHTALLPHALAYNAPEVPLAIARMQQALGKDDIPRFLYDIAKFLGAEMALEKIGMPRDFSNAIDEVFRKPYWNPRPLERAPLEALVQSALEGRAPGGA